MNVYAVRLNNKSMLIQATTINEVCDFATHDYKESSLFLTVKIVAKNSTIAEYKERQEVTNELF